MIRTIRDMLVGALVTAFMSVAWAAFNINIPQGPFLGDQIINPYTLALAINNMNNMASTSGLTALAGGGQAGATQLNFGLNQVATVATTADSTQLPACGIQSIVFVSNDGANATTVYGSAIAGRTDTINGTAGSTGVSQAAASHALYFCYVPSATSGKWVSIRAAS